ncbi:hypothetical protein BASA50_006719 [Batrachochytrium salamandrivorans]|uniref:Sugar phosphate transporter domain-containing protein n=1 Tax=Batrachochytrium salamandrivorans TaxID=1357716 RepID=A0ABQ8F8W8_9FUNG|nr:hypothetical protein BASA50_006719 [Batrachochytrium salamandrivorans]
MRVSQSSTQERGGAASVTAMPFDTASRLQVLEQDMIGQHPEQSQQLSQRLSKTAMIDELSVQNSRDASWRKSTTSMESSLMDELRRPVYPKSGVSGSQSVASELSPSPVYTWAKTIKVLLIIGSWYTTSISLHLLNKWTFSRDHYAFPFPMLTTMFQMMFQFGLSSLVIVLAFPHLLPNRPPSILGYMQMVLPCGIATGLDLGLSNSSLKSITLSFYTMVKSGSPVFVLLFAFLFGFERPTVSMITVILVIVLGVWIMVANESKFDAVGYTEVQIATVMSGLRWTLTHMLLKNPSFGTNHPLTTTLFVTPVVSLSLFVAFLILEGVGSLGATPQLSTSTGILEVAGLMLCSGVVSFILILLELTLITETSVVTFSVAGIFKEIITIAISAFVFGDRFTGNVLLGLVVSICGIAGYNFLRLSQSNELRGATPSSSNLVGHDVNWKSLPSEDDMYDVEMELQLQLQLQID